jgi:Flp pilus assembly protein protease CpaA
MDMIPIVHAITCITIAIILFYSSLKDFKYRTISRRSVAIVFIIVLAYRLIVGIPAESSFAFLYVFIAFVALAAISRGKFGMGDALLIGAVSWQLGSFNEIQQFIYAMGISGIALWIFYFVKNKEYKNIKESLTGNKITTVPINEVKIGSVLATDNFMAGLTELDIDKLKKSGVKEIQTKTQPMPFIPCIFIAYLIAILI